MNVTMIKDDEVGAIEAGYDNEMASTYRIERLVMEFDDDKLGKCQVYSAVSDRMKWSVRGVDVDQLHNLLPKDDEVQLPDEKVTAWLAEVAHLKKLISDQNHQAIIDYFIRQEVQDFQKHGLVFKRLAALKAKPIESLVALIQNLINQTEAKIADYLSRKKSQAWAETLKDKGFHHLCAPEKYDDKSSYVVTYEEDCESDYFPLHKEKKGTAKDLLSECYVPLLDCEFSGDQMKVVDDSDAEDDGEDDPMDLSQDALETEKQSEIEDADAEEGLGGTLRSFVSVQVPEDKIRDGAQSVEKKPRIYESEADPTDGFAEPKALKKIKQEKSASAEGFSFFAHRKEHGSDIRQFPDKNAWLEACIHTKDF